MKSSITIEHWNWPIFKAEPNGFDLIEIYIREPSVSVEVNVTIPLKDARIFGERLIRLSQVLEEVK